MQKGFIFDLNKCTGCNACQIACSIENEVELPFNWRQVNTFNEPKHPDISYFHLSTACHHCIEPPCLKYCPALAISKDQDNGAVLIDQDKCIGCKYCSWVCPYDAPTFNHSKKIMEKCTLCFHRLKEELLPACVTLCPTSALQIGDHQDHSIPDPVAGFTKSDIKPAITFIPLRENQQLPEIDVLPYDDITIQLFRESLKKDNKKEKINSLKEWPLVLFSLLLAFITGSFTASLLKTSSSTNILPLILSLFALGISILHLGKKTRAPRAILNLKNSWLSREIAFFTLFVSLLAIQTIIFSEIKWLGWIAVISGFFALFSLDKVYSVVAVVKKLNYHSADTLLTGLFFASLFSEFKFGIIIFGGIKLVLYLKQFSNRSEDVNILLIISASSRLALGFLFPLIFWYWEIPGAWTVSIILILIAELIDRCEYYDNLKTITPQKQMVMDLEKIINHKDTE